MESQTQTPAQTAPQAAAKPKAEVAKLGPVERALIGGDLSLLNEAERAAHYVAICESLRLNPLTRPFNYIEIDGKLILYATKDCTDQLRSRDDVSVVITSREVTEGVYVVTAQAEIPKGRRDESIGAVPLVSEGGEWTSVSDGKGGTKRKFAPDGKTTPLLALERANAMKKAETQAKRRVTLSICGLGFPDETEIDYISPSAPKPTMPRRIADAEVANAAA